MKLFKQQEAIKQLKSLSWAKMYTSNLCRRLRLSLAVIRWVKLRMEVARKFIMRNSGKTKYWFRLFYNPSKNTKLIFAQGLFHPKPCHESFFFAVLLLLITHFLFHYTCSHQSSGGRKKNYFSLSLFSRRFGIKYFNLIFTKVG